MNPKRILIIGASGLVGKHVLHLCQAQGWSVDGTYVARSRPGLIHLDLASQNLAGINFSNYSHLFIAAGISHIENCYLNPEQSSRVNVDGVLKILNLIKSSGTIPIFLSTDYVFDGINGNYSEHDARLPHTVYGKQKVIIEDYVIQNFERFLILRLGKIISSNPEDRTFLTDWLVSLNNRQTILAAEDQIASLLDVTDMLDAFRRILSENIQGIYHIASGVPYSKLKIAQALAGHLHLDYSNITSCRINELGLKEKRPVNTSLNSDKIKKEISLSFKSLEETINDLVMRQKALV